MKKIFLLIIPTTVLLFFTLSNQNNSTLFLLNWGEYIDTELIVKFEEEYDCTVVMDEVGSSEDMYQKIKTGTTPYDVAIPGDYIIEKMYKEDLLEKLDYSKIANYSSEMFNDDLTRIRRNNFFEGNESYAVPYFWGAYALIYSTKNKIVEETVRDNGFKAIFDRSLYGTYQDSVRLAMYDVPRFASTAYLLTKNKDINTTKVSDFDGLVSTLQNAKYALWGNDLIKKQIAQGNIDVGLVQLGDFFDQLYLSSSSNETITFNCYIPNNTAIFFDAMVIPKTSRNQALAYKFINFMIDSDNSFQNASFVGYTPPIKAVVQKIKDSSDFKEMLSKYPFYIDPLAGRDALIFRDIETMDNNTPYQDFLITIVNKAKAGSN